LVEQEDERDTFMPRIFSYNGLEVNPLIWHIGAKCNCTLIVLIDDAASQLLGLQYYHSETTQA